MALGRILGGPRRRYGGRQGTPSAQTFLVPHHAGFPVPPRSLLVSSADEGHLFVVRCCPTYGKINRVSCVDPWFSRRVLVRPSCGGTGAQAPKPWSWTLTYRNSGSTGSWAARGTCLGCSSEAWGIGKSRVAMCSRDVCGCGE